MEGNEPAGKLKEQISKFLLCILKVTEESSHPDPLVRGTDPRIRIRTKMSPRIPNTPLPSPFHGSHDMLYSVPPSVRLKFAQIF
jgi:hypothetical protein